MHQPNCNVTKKRDGGCLQYDYKKLTTTTSWGRGERGFWGKNLPGGKPIILYDLARCLEKCRDK